MNSFKHMTITFMLTAIALGIAAAPAAAQGIEGSLYLPHSAWFGDTLLRPGHYTIAMRTPNTDRVKRIRITGEGVSKTVLATPQTITASRKASLNLLPIEGEYVMTRLDAGIVGESYQMGVTHKFKNRVLTARSQPGNEAPVLLEVGF